ECAISFEGPSDITPGAVNDSSVNNFPDPQGWSPAFIWQGAWPTEVFAAYALDDPLLVYTRQTQRFQDRAASVGAGQRVHIETITGATAYPAPMWGHNRVSESERTQTFAAWLAGLARHAGAPTGPAVAPRPADGWIATCNAAGHDAVSLLQSSRLWQQRG